MKEHFALLGHHVKDLVTGFSGVVTGICFDLYGCVQAVVTPRFDLKPEKEVDSRYFDLKRLVLDGDWMPEKIMEVPTFEAVPGPENKPLPPSARFSRE